MARFGVPLSFITLLLVSQPAFAQAICAPVRTIPTLARSVDAGAQFAHADLNTVPIRLVQPSPNHVQGRTKTVITACDGWTGQDKYKHAAYSFTFTTSMYYFVKSATGMSRKQSLLVSLGTMTAVGLGKEWLDWQNSSKRCFSAGDMLANGVGMLAAAGFVLVF